MDGWDVALMLSILAVVLAAPRVSPCFGCMMAEGADGGECRRDCRAFDEFEKRSGRSR